MSQSTNSRLQKSNTTLKSKRSESNTRFDQRNYHTVVAEIREENTDYETWLYVAVANEDHQTSHQHLVNKLQTTIKANEKRSTTNYKYGKRNRQGTKYKRRQQRKEKRKSDAFARSNNEEAERKEAYAQMQHTIISQSWLYYDMQYGISLDDLCQVIDPIRHYRAMVACTSKDLIGSVKPLECISVTTTPRSKNDAANVAIAFQPHDPHLTEEEIHVGKYNKIQNRL